MIKLFLKSVYIILICLPTYTMNTLEQSSIYYKNRCQYKAQYRSGNAGHTITAVPGITSAIFSEYIMSASPH